MVSGVTKKMICGSPQRRTSSTALACLGTPDPVDMKVYRPEGKETFNDEETTEEAPS